MKTGRKLKMPPQDAAAQIETMAAEGYSQLGIAKKLGTSVDTFVRWLDENPELAEAMKAGREDERWKLHNMLFKQAIEKGNATAAMFLLKARHGYREGDQTETANRVTINFQLPGPISMEEFKLTKVIDGNANNRDDRISAQRIAVAGGR